MSGIHRLHYILDSRALAGEQRKFECKQQEKRKRPDFLILQRLGRSYEWQNSYANTRKIRIG
jgi:hypothetical protein